MKSILFGTSTSGSAHDLGLALLRLGVGLLLAYYGAQKLLGVWGGNGFEATMATFTTKMGIPAPFAFLAIVAEFFGGLGLAVGLLTRVAAIGAFSTMAVAFVVNINRAGLDSFSAGRMDGVSQMAYPFVLALGALVFVLGGAGRFSIDAMINRK